MPGGRGTVEDRRLAALSQWQLPAVELTARRRDTSSELCMRGRRPVLAVLDHSSRRLAGCV